MDNEPLLSNSDLAYAVQMVHATCCLAGSASYLADIREDLRGHGIIRAVKDHDTPALFDWLIKTLSFQGISDTVAAGYIAQHGSVRWSDIADALSASPSCPKLSGYWRFYDCRYHKGAHTCSEPAHIEACPLPRHQLRNGRLNQMAYSLFLFMRDIADADFVGWIDRQLAMVDPHAPDRLAACREAVIGPHRLESCGYTAVRNAAAKDGLWKMSGGRQVIYARADLSERDRIIAAERLADRLRFAEVA
jgi:hypothetical protein